jgi:hypothetical protein
VVVLTSGDFAFALSHSDCFSGESGHHKCEMECCTEADCCAEEQGTIQITDDSDGCCETHIEQAVEQDLAVLLINKVSEYQSQSERSFSINELNDYVSYDYSVLTHKFKTSNIFLELSNLRI